MFSSKQKVLVLAACAGALLANLAIFNLISSILPTADDVEIYFRYARRALSGELPYRDYLVEYPPFSLPFFILPGAVCQLLGTLTLPAYKIAFHTQAFLLALLTLWTLFRLLLKLQPDLTWPKMGWRLGVYSFGCVAISLYLFQRYDIAATFLTFLAVTLLIYERPGLAGFALGTATACKLYPVILLPLFLLYIFYKQPRLATSWASFWKTLKATWPTLLKSGVAFSLGVVLISLPFFLASPSGFLKFLSYHSERGLELETIFAGIVVFASWLNFVPAITMVEAAALGLASPWVKPLATFSTLLTVGGLGLFYLWFWYKLAKSRGGSSKYAQFLLTACSFVLLWFIVANKVLSPQYLIWLLPFMAVWQGRWKIGLFLVALPLSFIPFPFLVDGIIALEPLPFIILFVRNILLVVIFWSLGRELRRAF